MRSAERIDLPQFAARSSPHSLIFARVPSPCACVGRPGGVGRGLVVRRTKVDPRMLVVLPHAWHARPHAVRRAPWPRKSTPRATARSRRCIIDQLGTRATVHEHDVPGHSRPQLPTRPAATEPTSSMVARWCFGTSSAACANNSSKCSIPEGPGVGTGPSDNAWTRIP